MKDPKEKKREWNESKLSGFFDDGTEIQGELKFKGSFRIDGFFKGKIISADMLIIGERGHVDAEVRVGYAVINGEFHGQIFGEEKVEIHDKGRVFGTVMSPKLQTTESPLPEEPDQKVD